MKRHLILFLVLALVCSTFTFVFADDYFTYNMINGWRCTYQDVQEDQYYTDAVEWAVVDNIFVPEGKTFGVGKLATRAECVMVLYKAAGSPHLFYGMDTIPFVDVKETDEWCDAVIWAYNNGITKGMDEKHFNPNGTLTRAEMFTMLWRVDGGRTNNTKIYFTDVVEGSYYETAVRWGYDQKLVKGVSDTSFAPKNTLKRVDLLTFCYRYFEQTYSQRNQEWLGLDDYTYNYYFNTSGTDLWYRY